MNGIACSGIISLYAYEFRSPFEHRSTRGWPLRSTLAEMQGWADALIDTIQKCTCSLFDMQIMRAPVYFTTDSSMDLLRDTSGREAHLHWVAPNLDMRLRKERVFLSGKLTEEQGCGHGQHIFVVHCESAGFAGRPASPLTYLGSSTSSTYNANERGSLSKRSGWVAFQASYYFVLCFFRST